MVIEAPLSKLLYLEIRFGILNLLPKIMTVSLPLSFFYKGVAQNPLPSLTHLILITAL